MPSRITQHYKKAHNWQYGIGVPKGDVARTAQEAETIAKQLGRENPTLGRVEPGLIVIRWRGYRYQGSGSRRRAGERHLR